MFVFFRRVTVLG